MTRRSRGALALGGVVLLAAIGFAVVHDGDEPDGPDDAATRAACTAMVAALPGTVAGQESVELADAGEWMRAWGDPAIVLRCGVEEPAAFDPTSQCLTVDDIDWFATQNGKAVDGSSTQKAPVDFTTVGRSVNVEVSVPAEWEPASDALVDVAPAIAGTTDATKPCR